MLEACSTACTGVGSNDIEAAVTVIAQWEGSSRYPHSLCDSCHSRERPVDQCSDRLAHPIAQGKRKPGNKPASDVARAPKQGIPPRLVVESVVEIEKKRSAAAKLRHTPRESGGSVRNVMQ